MAQQTINIGASPNDGTGTPLRTAFQYTNSNFSELYTAVGPSGNNIVVPGNATITGDLTVDTNSLYVNSSTNNVGLGTITPSGASGRTLEIYGGAGQSRLALKNDTTGSASTDGSQIALVGSQLVIQNREASEITFETNNSERYRLASDGVATWSNVGGVAGTAMTLNANGLGIGVTPSAWSAGGFMQLPSSRAFAFAGAFGDYISNGYYDGSWKYTTTAAVSRYRQDAGSHQWFTAPSGTAGTAITFTQAMTLNANGALALQGGNTSANGVGIAFPATQVASSDANTLDDYEEGTWTGTLAGTTTNPTTPVTATGRYTKIGRQVSVQIQFTNVDTTGASGQIKVTGLPASFNNNSSVSAIGSVLMSSIGTFTGSPAAFIGVNTTEIELYSSISGSAAGLVTHNAGASRSLYINITYTV